MSLWHYAVRVFCPKRTSREMADSMDGRAFSVEGKPGIGDLKRSDRRGYDGFAALSGRGRYRISYL
jgi:hypothetical protein